MASIKNSLGLVMMAIVVLAVMSPKSEATVRCHTVIDDLKPCLAYVTNRGPLSACCTGVGALYDLENTTKDRQRICKCLKSALKSYKHIAEAAAMTGICGVALPYEISPSTDCSRVT